MKRWIVITLLLGLPFAELHAQEVEATNAVKVLMFHGQELFEVPDISSVSSEKRVEVLTRRLTRAAKSPLVNSDHISIDHDDDLKVSLIMLDSDVLCAIWESDATYHDVPREKLAESWKVIIQDVINQYRKDRTSENYMKGGIFSAIATVVFLVIALAIRLLTRKEIQLVEKKFSGQKMLKFLDGDSLVTINGNVMKFLRTVVMITVFIFYLNLVLSFFPWTFNLSARLFELISTPVINLGRGFVENLPNFFTLTIICILTSFILRNLKNIFGQIGEGKVRIKSFYRDWADPTYRLVRIVVIVFAAVVAYPSIPGSGSPAFKGISIFMGVLFSLGSTSAVGNIVAGLVLTYMRPFITDDFVEISSLRGTVISRGTFSTRLKTPTNEIISIPNASVSANHIINFSRMAERGGVNVGTAITISYDVPWRTVHELLISAAKGVPDVQENPPPKVLQLSLNDFYVQYKLIVTTAHPERRFSIRSNLHQNIQDNFAKAGVEIMSPHFQANRSGETSTIPELDPSTD
ncbi:MAG: mechanosensitive ion channel family protein [Kiritimatiellaceae bacterium]|nr:mechanosensitive ion channel family protein [Kiritimatiellaceae bacterium]